MISCASQAFAGVRYRLPRSLSRGILERTESVSGPLWPFQPSRSVARLAEVNLHYVDRIQGERIYSSRAMEDSMADADIIALLQRILDKLDKLARTAATTIEVDGIEHLRIRVNYIERELTA